MHLNIDGTLNPNLNELQREHLVNMLRELADDIEDHKAALEDFTVEAQHKTHGVERLELNLVVYKAVE